MAMNSEFGDMLLSGAGGEFEPALLQQPFGISRTDAASFIFKGFQAAVTGCHFLLACCPVHFYRAGTDTLCNKMPPPLALFNLQDSIDCCYCAALGSADVLRLTKFSRGSRNCAHIIQSCCSASLSPLHVPCVI